MIELIAHNLAPMMFGALIIVLLLGYPVTFSLAFNGLLFFLVAVELSPYSTDIHLSWPLIQTLPVRVLR
jgi:TRAP-type mannitol/chloroaromatic compound transport system permease large subunit